jgi:hypothetical protein
MMSYNRMIIANEQDLWKEAAVASYYLQSGIYLERLNEFMKSLNQYSSFLGQFSKQLPLECQ